MLKQVKIINFKSFLYEIVSFKSSRTYLLLGMNGQGKSNFYSALEFLFKKSPPMISPEEKRSLLHGSLEQDDVTVEALIDNSNSRFPV